MSRKRLLRVLVELEWEAVPGPRGAPANTVEQSRSGGDRAAAFRPLATVSAGSSPSRPSPCRGMKVLDARVSAAPRAPAPQHGDVPVLLHHRPLQACTRHPLAGLVGPLFPYARRLL